MNIKLLDEHNLEFLSLKEGYTGSSESNHVKMPHCWKSHVAAHLSFCNTASNLCLLLQKEQNVKGGEGPSGKQAVGINNGTR